MSFAAAEKVLQTVLYEGYALYPYRPSLKNQRRWTFGGVEPGGQVRAELLLEAPEGAEVEVRIRFLHLCLRDEWETAVEREVRAGPFALRRQNTEPAPVDFHFDADPASGTQRTVSGRTTFRAQTLRDDVWRATVTVENATVESADARALAPLTQLASVHAVLCVEQGRFASAIDPPESLRSEAHGCRNQGLFPVLVGDRSAQDTVLASPIILYDFPRIADESQGELFDGTEIDEILSLRILTLTDEEKRLARRTDPRVAALLDRVEAMDEAALRRLHGRVDGRVRPGDRVRLKPQGRADAFDLLLAGKAATVLSLEHDVEGQSYVTVAIDDDPGRELASGGKPGHRFFFRTEEVEAL